MKIHENLRKLRTASGLTQEQVADRVGLTRQALSSYESGRTRPDIEMLEKLAEIYGTDLNAVLYGDSLLLARARKWRAVAVVSLVVTAVLSTGGAVITMLVHQFLLPAESQSYFPALHLAGALTCAASGLAFLGIIVLLILEVIWRPAVTQKQCWMYIGILLAVIMGIPALISLSDPVFKVIDYVWYHLQQLPLILLVAVVGRITGVARCRKKGKI